ncbi:hypothetical protein [Bathymodiolus platifrons methanotrophic gill symbiont]|uniref:hypothetical protein n=1 Tax=Bathymodiolus platifrons methanotrophic gill symbiont TaxID=113268 RepID=UPI00142E434F|nr:hypothetical protein [Bathymodiolus platifrons methanotrophic gill symbiont]
MATPSIRIHYFTDVLCVWAYLAQVRLDELIKNYASDIELVIILCQSSPVPSTE